MSCKQTGAEVSDEIQRRQSTGEFALASTLIDSLVTSLFFQKMQGDAGQKERQKSSRSEDGLEALKSNSGRILRDAQPPLVQQG